MKNKLLTPSFLALLFLTGCGSGSSSEPQDNNIAPQVSVSNASGEEGTQVTIQAQASDEDGSIADYSWQQTGGTQAKLVDKDDSVTVFIPEVSETETLMFTLTVTDDDGAQTTTSFEVLAQPSLTELTLVGQVLTSVTLPETFHLVVDIGSQSFITQSNEHGHYEIPVAVDDANLDQLVQVSAFYQNQQSVVKLVSIGRDFAHHVERAGSDKKAVPTELPSLLISSLTTAQAAQFQWGSGNTPTNNSELEAATDNLGLGFIYDFALSIELIVNAFASNQSAQLTGILPGDFNNTYDDFSHIVTASHVSEKVLSFFTEGKGAVEELWLKKLGSNSGVNLTNQPEPIYGFSSRFTFQQNGKGRWLSNRSKFVQTQKFDWQADEGQFRISFPLNYHYLNGKSYDSLTITPLMETSSELLLHITEVLIDDRTEELEIKSSEAKVFKKTAGLLQPLDAIELGHSYQVNIRQIDPPSRQGYVRSGKIQSYLRDIVFESFDAASATGKATVTSYQLSENDDFDATESAIEWRLENRQISFQLNQQSVEMVLMYRSAGEFVTNTMIATGESEQDGVSMAHSARMARVEELSMFTDEMVTGKVLAVPALSSSAASRTWVELNSDGTMAFVKTKDQDRNGTIDLESDQVQVMGGLWKVEEGKLITLQHSANGTSIAETCFGGTWGANLSDNCIAYKREAWSARKLLQDSRTKPILIKEQSWYEDRFLFREGIENKTPLSVYLAVRQQVSYPEFLTQRPVALPSSLFDGSTTEFNSP